VGPAQNHAKNGPEKFQGFVERIPFISMLSY
jgi:hypothetical protein